MISAEQIKIIHVYASGAAMTDKEYRAVLAEVTARNHHGHPLGSSTDRAFTNKDVDDLMCHLEAEVEYRVNTGHPGAHWPVLKGQEVQRDYWRRRKGPKGTPSTRQRFTEQQADDDLASAVLRMRELGYGDGYCNAVARTVCRISDRGWTMDNADPGQKRKIVAALARTIASKESGVRSQEPVTATAELNHGDTEGTENVPAERMAF